MKETQLSEAEDMKRSVAEELRRTREQLMIEREKWHEEREALKQVSMHCQISKIMLHVVLHMTCTVNLKFFIVKILIFRRLCKLILQKSHAHYEH